MADLIKYVSYLEDQLHQWRCIGIISLIALAIVTALYLGEVWTRCAI